jgi:hypothetical protein
LGILALVPPGANNWFEKLPLKGLPAYFYLIRAVKVPPEQLLRLEHLEIVDEIPFKANPLKLLEEVNIGYNSGVPFRLWRVSPKGTITSTNCYLVSLLVLIF